MHSLASALAENEYKVSIICPFPNYPTGVVFEDYKGKIYSRTFENNLTVYRLWVWPSNSQNKFVRLLSMFSFSISLALFFVLKKIPDKVLVQYSPVFVGFTAVFWAWIFRKKVILNISDLWPLAGLEMGLLKKGGYYSALQQIERFCYRRASLLMGQSEEILTYAKSLGIEKPHFLYRNFPRFEPTKIIENSDPNKITLVYAGLLGIAQGIHTICTKIKFPKNVFFHIYGAGPEVDAIKRLENAQIIYHGEVSRQQLHRDLISYDIAFIPLIKRIYGSVPSKIFEYTRLGLPVLYVAGGEGENIVTATRLGWTLPVNDLEQFQFFIDGLSSEKLREFPKDSIQQNAMNAFNFDEQFERFLEKLIRL